MVWRIFSVFGIVEGLKDAFNTLVSSFIDMIINGIGFIIGFFNKDAGQALKDFSFKDMFNAYIDTLIDLVNLQWKVRKKIADTD